jgi:hypothetical protein
LTTAGILVFPVLITVIFTSFALSNTAYFGDANSTNVFGGSVEKRNVRKLAELKHMMKAKTRKYWQFFPHLPEVDE